MLIKLIVTLFLGAYSLDTLMNSYKTMTSENTFTEMKEYMYHQQKREDKLREICHLELYILPEEPSFVENLIDNYHQYLNSNHYLTSKMEASTKQEFMNLSYDNTNLGADIVYGGQTYTLKRAGVKPSRTYSYANQMHERYPVDPIWTVIVNDHKLTVTNIE